MTRYGQYRGPAAVVAAPSPPTVPMPAGSFVTRVGKQIHYDGAKDVETILQIVGEDPAFYQSRSSVGLPHTVECRPGLG
jgi:hypothetical protein